MNNTMNHEAVLAIVRIDHNTFKVTMGDETVIFKRNMSADVCPGCFGMIERLYAICKAAHGSLSKRSEEE